MNSTKQMLETAYDEIADKIGDGKNKYSWSIAYYI